MTLTVMPDASALRHVTGMADFDRVRWSRLVPTEIIHPHDGAVGVLRHRNLAAPAEWTTADVPGSRNHVLLYVEQARPAPLEVIMAGRAQRLVTAPGTVMVMPAGLDRAFRSRARGERMLHLHLDPGWLARLAAREGMDEADLPALVDHPDPILRRLLARLASIRLPGPDGLFHEQVGVEVAAALLRRARPPARLALAPVRLARVKAFIEAHLDSSIGLAQLAEVAGLSSFHFARAFRADTGFTPHGWVMERRCQRALALLSQTGMDIAAIARACGFASQAHLTRLFAQRFGMPPGRWRRGLG